MCDGNISSEGEDGAYADLDEFLCEYVDGTMDPSVRAAFEEYLRINPMLCEHIECLRQTRSVLCEFGCQLRAPAALQDRLRQRLGAEFVSPTPVMPHMIDSLNWIAGVSSVLLLVCGFIAANYGTRVQDGAGQVAASAVETRVATGWLMPRTASIDGFSTAALTQVPVVARRSFSRGFWVEESSRRDTFVTRVQPLSEAIQTAAIP